MFVLENLLYALKSLQQHRLRSFLTMLGVIFGVAAVIAMLSIGKGAEEEAVDQIKAFGLNNIRVSSIILSKEQEDKAKRTLSKGLSYEDATYIKSVLPYIDQVAPQNLLDKKVNYQEFSPVAKIVGTTSEYLTVTGLNLERGRFINDDDLQQFRKVCILGYNLNRQLFLKENPIGKLITIGGIRFRVVGLARDKAKTKDKVKIKSRDVNNDIYIPITTSMRKFTITEAEKSQENQTA
ncbi:MAG: ABC transporter permease, partial [Candidatus Sericytochromatia bacterium]|nr:ABC transporter permease [Candidatus Sericytochromatia bacterium]